MEIERLDSELLCGFGATQGSVALDFSKYPSGEPLVKHGAATRAQPTTLLVRQRSMDSFLAAMFWVDALVERGFKPPRLVLPQVPGARQDRLNDSGDYLFTAKSVARMLNARNFPAVDVLDPHSDVIPALIDRCHVMQPSMNLPKDLYAGVIAPDAGAEKRAHKVAQANNLPLIHAWKTRDVTTGAISGFGVQPLPPKVLANGYTDISDHQGHYLVVDDLCDGGGTFIGLAAVLAERGATADLFVSHGLFTKGTQPLLDCFKQVITTDSTVGEKLGVIVLPVCASFIQALNA